MHYRKSVMVIGANFKSLLTIQLVKQYLTEGKYKEILLNSQAVGIGFVDGDTVVVYQK